MILTAEDIIEKVCSMSILEKERFYELFFPWIEEERRKEKADKENTTEPMSENE
jgi:hypothetical protein